MLNRIIIMGRLGKDPELRHTQQGTPVASFSLAVDRDFKDKGTGERVTDWIDVVAWRQTGEFVSRYFTKGRMAVVEGRLQMRDWNDRDGNKRRSAEVVADNVYFGDSKRTRTAAVISKAGTRRETATLREAIPRAATSSPAMAGATAAHRRKGSRATRPLITEAFRKLRKMTVRFRFNSNRPLHRRAGRPVLKGVNGYGKRTNRQHELLG